MELQMTLFNLLGTQVSSTIANLPGMNRQMAAEVVERSMDIALGPRERGSRFGAVAHICPLLANVGMQAAH